jgi:hypothetical protein
MFSLTYETMTNEQMWAIYAQGIAQAAGLPSSPPNFILTGTSLVANLATNSVALPKTAVPTTAQALFQIYGLANTEAALQGIYTPSQLNFFSQYATYIDNLIPEGSQLAPTPTQSAQIQILQVNISTANAQLAADYTSASTAWTTQGVLFPGKYPSFQSFLSQTSWGLTINNDNNTLGGYNSALSTLLTTVYGHDYVAIQQAKNTVDNIRTAMLGPAVIGPQTMLVTADAGNLVVPTYNPSSLQAFSSWVDSTIGQHGQATPIKVNFNQAAGEYDFTKSTYFSHTDFSTNYFFFSVGGSSTTSRTQVNINTSSSAFSLEFQFDSITQVSLTKGPWYDSSLMSKFPNPNNLSVPTSLIVAMYPKITMKMDAASYASAFSSYNSASGFGFGSFWVSASHSTSSSNLSMSATWDSSSNSVTIESSSINPVIVGMQLAQVGVGHSLPVKGVNVAKKIAETVS